MASVSVEGLGSRGKKSSKVTKILRALREHPDYTAAQVYGVLRGSVSRQYVANVISKYRSQVLGQGTPEAQNSQHETQNGLRVESLVQAVNLLAVCGGDVENAIRHIETVALLRK